MTSLFPTRDFDGARIVRMTYTPARKFIPGFLNWWIALADGSTIQLRCAEVRGVSDKGIAATTLTDLTESPKSPFATDIPVPVYEGGQPGRIFQVQGPLNRRYVPLLIGEVVAAQIREIEPAEEMPAIPEVAAPIDWESAVSILVSTRLLGVRAFERDGVAMVDVRMGSPRGEYVMRMTGMTLLEDRGYPGDRGVSRIELGEAETGGVRLEVHPGAKGREPQPVVVEGASLGVHKVVTGAVP